MVDLKRVWVISVGLWLAFGCGPKFVGVELGEDAGAAGAQDAEPGGGTPSVGGAAAGASASGRSGSGGSRPSGGQSGASSGAGGATGGVGGVLPLGGGGFGGVVVEPPQVPQDGLELWFDALLGVTAPGGVVSTWKDRSSNARNATQMDAMLSPTYVKDGLNGKPTVVFDGADDFLAIPALPGQFQAGVSIFVVGQWDQERECAGFFEASNGQEIDDVHLGQWQNRHLLEVEIPYIHADLGIALGKPQLSVGRVSPTEPAVLRFNGESIGVSDQLKLPASKPREKVYLGKTEYNGCTTLPGRISEALVYNRAVTNTEQAAIEGYLQDKWDCCGK